MYACMTPVGFDTSDKFENHCSKLIVNGNSVTDPASICTELNQHFCNIGHKTAGANDKPSKNVSSVHFYGRVINSIYIEDASEDEILDIINNLNPNKAAPGYDDIPTKLIKAAKFSLAPIHNIIFNSCLKNGLYPDELKIARVIPLHKGGAKFELKNYRSISILSAINKIFETIIKRDYLHFGLNIMFLFLPSLALGETILQPLPLPICMNYNNYCIG